MRAVNRSRALGALCSVLMLAACQEPEPHPPMVAVCNPGEVCKGTDNIGSTTSPQGGSGGIAGAPSVPTRPRSGKVVDLVDDSFRSGLPYADPAVVEAEGISVIQPLVTARYNGVDAFKLENFRELSETWISVRPETGRFHLRTLHPIPVEERDPITLGLVRAETIDFIFAVFPVPIERSPGYGQVVLSFTEATPPKGLAGVNVVSSAAAFIAYRIGGIWTEEADRTDSSGLVLLGNVVASAFPGTDARAALTLAGMPKGFVPVKVAADAVTVVEVPILP